MWPTACAKEPLLSSLPAVESGSGQPEILSFGLTRRERSRGGGQLHADGGAGAGRACDRDRATERVDAILEPDQPGSSARVSAPDAVIPNLELEHLITLP